MSERRTISSLAAMKAAGERIVMVTAYDHPSAQIAEAADVDAVLVGDSAAMTMLGYDSTVPVSVDEMLMLTAAVRRGIRTPLLVGDLPFGSYEASDQQAVATAQRFVKEAGCDAVKIERGGTTVHRARAIVDAGIPVMGHVGLTPQTAAITGSYRARGRSADDALMVFESALALQEAGCFALVFEAVPAAATAAMMAALHVPVIGIGAGGDTDGQVLVWHDLLGFAAADRKLPKFVRRYASMEAEATDAVAQFCDDVRSGRFPSSAETYHMTDQMADALGLYGARSPEHEPA